MQAVSELPTANRDTLAYLMVHLQHIASCEETKMTYNSLARIFGPTIVGFSMVDPPMTEMLPQTQKQTKVVEALLRIPEEEWNHILTTQAPERQCEYILISCYVVLFMVTIKIFYE